MQIYKGPLKETPKSRARVLRTPHNKDPQFIETTIGIVHGGKCQPA